MTTGSIDRHDRHRIVEQRSDVALHRHRITCGYDDSGWFTRRQPGIRCVRNEIKIYARADNQGHRATIDHGARHAWIGVLQVRAVDFASEAFIGETFAVSFRARNTGAAVWLMSAPGDRGTVRLGWRWSLNGVTREEGRTPLDVDIRPGRVARFVARVAVPAAPGDYTLTLDLVSESVTWFAAQGQRPVTAAVKVKPLDVDDVLSTSPPLASRSATAAISTDRASYGRRDTIRLAVELRNAGRPGQFDAYLVGQGPGGRVWFFDGRQLFPSTGLAWIAWSRGLPFPARASGRFELPAATLEPGAYRWHVMLTEADTVRPLATGTTAFTIGP